MILIDTSIWIDHLRQSDQSVGELLRNQQALIHPYVLGEIALGNFGGRTNTLNSLSRLPAAAVANHDEVMGIIETEMLSGTGIGYVDAHLIASTKLMPGSSLWTRDKRLRSVAERMKIALDLN